MQGTVPAPLTRLLVEVAAMHGLERETLIAGARLDDAVLADPEGRVPFDRHMRLWELVSAAGEATRDIGLRLGAMARPEALGVAGYVALNAPTVGEACARLTHFRRLIHDVIVVDLIAEEGNAVVRQVFPPEIARLRHPAEAAVTAVLTFARVGTGVEWAPREVWFQHSEPADLSTHRALIGCPIFFNRPELRVVLDGAVIDYPMRKPDPALGAHLARHAAALEAALPDERTLTSEVRRILVEELRGAVPDQGRVARRLALSGRTLQRRLRDEGRAFSELVEEVRRELSKLYLGDARITISEVAFLLGYSESSAFFRAFRRWTGETPGAFRLAATTPKNKPRLVGRSK